MSDPIAINERLYLSGRARTSHRSVIAHSAFSTFTVTGNGLAGTGCDYRDQGEGRCITVVLNLIIMVFYPHNCPLAFDL